jgi:hypothetical protein
MSIMNYNSTLINEAVLKQFDVTAKICMITIYYNTLLNIVFFCILCLQLCIYI